MSLLKNEHTYSSIIVPLVSPAKALLGITLICMLSSRSLKGKTPGFHLNAIYTNVIMP